MLYSFSIILFGLLPAAMLFLCSKFEKKVGVPSTLKIVGWVVFIGYTMKCIYLAYAIPNELYFRTVEYTKNDIYLGQLLLLLAVTSFLIGFVLIGDRRLKPFSIRIGSFRVLDKIFYWFVFASATSAAVLFFYLKGFHEQIISGQFQAVRYLIVAETGQRDSLGYLQLGMDILVIFALYFIARRKSRFVSSIYMPAILIVSVSYFLSGQRFGIIIILIAFILISRKGLFNLFSRSALRNSLIILLSLSLLSIASVMRDERAAIKLSDVDLLEGVDSTLEHAFQGIYALDPAKLTGIVLRHDDYLLGGSFVMFVTAPIPRVLWPDKPDVRIGPYVAQEILDFRNQSGAPPSAIGEFYINFGWLGVAIGMLLLGCVAALSKSLYLNSEDQDIGRSRYVCAMLILIFFLIGDFSYAALFAIKYGFAAIICERYWKQRKTQTSSPRAEYLSNRGPAFQLSDSIGSGVSGQRH